MNMTPPNQNAALTDEEAGATPSSPSASHNLRSSESTQRASTDIPGPSTESLVSPAELKMKVRLGDELKKKILAHRARLSTRVLRGEGPPIAIVGPCSIHCESAALEYAERLARLQERIGDNVQLVMRVYFEKPRTTVGWKGFLYDPDLDGSDDLRKGLERARKLMVKIAGLDLPIATEILDPIAAEYLEDCVSWVAIGARTSESQIHRQLASRLECPVGFKNGTDGSVIVAAQAMEAAATPHTHLGIDDHGRVCMRRSAGNPATHVVLRGGTSGPNYDCASVTKVVESLRAKNQNARVLIDCSHGNCEKDHDRQPHVAREVIAQLASGSDGILGVMIESHLSSGRQSVEAPRKYGVSVTDACIDFSTTEAILLEMARV